VLELQASPDAEWYMPPEIVGKRLVLQYTRQ
jgi:hypothetical protein